MTAETAKAIPLCSLLTAVRFLLGKNQSHCEPFSPRMPKTSPSLPSAMPKHRKPWRGPLEEIPSMRSLSSDPALGSGSVAHWIQRVCGAPAEAVLGTACLLPSSGHEDCEAL